MADMTIEGRMKALPDIQRSWLWELVIPNIGKVSTTIKTEEPLIVRCKSAVIPSRGTESIESNFLGMKQFFPGKPTFGNTMSVTFEETEDQIIRKTLYEWQQKMFDVVPGSVTAGVSQADHILGSTKRLLTQDVYLLMYKYNGELLDKKIKFVNAFPENVDDVAMSFDGGEAVKYSVTFKFDFWTLENK